MYTLQYTLHCCPGHQFTYDSQEDEWSVFTKEEHPNGPDGTNGCCAPVHTVTRSGGYLVVDQSTYTQGHIWKGLDPFATVLAPPPPPAFGGPTLVSAIPDATVFPGGYKSFNVTSHFNATKTPGSAFKYFVTTNNHALIEVRNQEDGTFELKSLSTSGNAKRRKLASILRNRA